MAAGLETGVLEGLTLRGAPDATELPTAASPVEAAAVHDVAALSNFVRASANCSPEERASRMGLVAELLPGIVERATAKLRADNPIDALAAADLLVGLGRVEQLLDGLGLPNEDARLAVISAISRARLCDPRLTAALRGIAEAPGTAENQESRFQAGLALQVLADRSPAAA